MASEYEGEHIRHNERIRELENINYNYKIDIENLRRQLEYVENQNKAELDDLIFENEDLNQKLQDLHEYNKNLRISQGRWTNLAEKQVPRGEPSLGYLLESNTASRPRIQKRRLPRRQIRENGPTIQIVE